jgi:NAD(P)-dependent dehydrogenase (short-subunit alcohol dehydrogenase family)
MAYAVTKAAQLQLVKCLGASQGPKIRVNTVLPGLLLTEWVCVSPCEFGVHLPGRSHFPQSLSASEKADKSCRA